MKRLFLAMALTTAAAFPAMAEMSHDQSSMQMGKMEEMKHRMDTLETKADGFDLTLDIMTHKDYQKMMKAMKMEPMKATAGTTHHIALSIRKENNRINDATVSIKVVSPEGKEETHLLTFNPDMMNQYVGHFNMPQKGKYQLSITFEAGKEKRQGGVNYEIK